MSLQDYSVSNRGLRAGLTGTLQRMVDCIEAFEAVGIDFFLLQYYPQLEEMERFSDAMLQRLA